MRTERLDQGFAVFNCHLNDAKERADREFIAQYGQAEFFQAIAPLHERGIMEIFEKPPTTYTTAWIVLCTAFANEDVDTGIIPPDPRVDAVATVIAGEDNWDFEFLPEVSEHEVDKNQFRVAARKAIKAYEESGIPVSA